MDTTPTGMLTFLLTDIEGSTHLWEAHPDSMRGALARHDALLRAAIERHQGHIGKALGDGVCASFGQAHAAVEAALEIQRALQDETWPEHTVLKVRIALHTTIVEPTDQDGFATPMRRMGFQIAEAYGGQTLLCPATAELVRERLPSGASLRALGVHRLRDTERTEMVFQLDHPALPSEFGPMRTGMHIPNNLPQQATRFIGREHELARVRQFLAEKRLLTLTGSGGTGKTRLAIQAAAELVDAPENGPEDGIWFVELAPLSRPDLVVHEVAGVLRLKEDSTRPILESLIQFLKDRSLLILLDNCEHLLDACAQLADTLLRRCPGVRLLASSREALGIDGEQSYRIPSLSLPDPKVPATPEQIVDTESVRLFVDRAQAVRTDFGVSDTNAPTLASICRHLDGIPLAIELAAARVRSLPVEEIEQRLDQRFRLLTDGSRTALPRHQTLRALIDWSYGLLSEMEKTLLHRLSVFAGGWDLESAESMCSGDGIEDWDILDLLTDLTDKSLVVAEASGPAIRYRLLETVRQYARDRLQETGEEAVWRDRHLERFLALAEEAEGNLAGIEQLTWLDRLETEQDNLRAALDWSLEDEVRAESGMRMCGALWLFWLVRGYLTEGRDRPSQCLERGAAQPNPARAKALRGLGVIACHQGDVVASRAYFEESLDLFRRLGILPGVAGALVGLGIVVFHQGDLALARTVSEESQEICRKLGIALGVGYALINLGNVAKNEGELSRARAYLEESLSIFQEKRDLRGSTLVRVALGEVASREGDTNTARAHFEESLRTFRHLGDRRVSAMVLVGLAEVFADDGHPLHAARLWGASERLREELGAPLPPSEQPYHDARVCDARAAADDDAAFDAAWIAGRAMPLEHAIDLALARLETPESPDASGVA